MKLESLSIRDFRGIKELELDFKDDLGLIRDVIPIVGPNTSGKTTILDAIALCLRPLGDSIQLRAGLRLSPPSIVRSGAVSAKVTATVWFSDDELAAMSEVTRQVKEMSNWRFWRNHVTLKWIYPDPDGKEEYGSYDLKPDNSFLQFMGRYFLSRYLHLPALGPGLFKRIGDVIMFDQQRLGLMKLMSSEEINQLSRLLDPDPLGRANGKQPVESSEQAGYRPTNDPRLILTSLAMRAQVPQAPGATEKEDFGRLKELYERVCHPHTIGELVNTKHGLDMEFRSDQGHYYYDGLSSGQQMILRMLLEFATRRIHRSIVLIDELELHLHPLWQDRLYTSLPKLGDDNQYFFTTHSTHLRDTIQDTFCHTTGDLNEPAVMG